LVFHLVEDRVRTIRKIQKMLKPGGVFVSSTPCLGGGYPVLKVLNPLGQFLGVMPRVRFFTPDELLSSLRQAGFSILREWRPNVGRTLFVVAQKDGRETRPE
jgi:2-polyprenyl-3-methyl-5-hydroxy-6-metoxy-1,4-benzoquinol methylase